MGIQISEWLDSLGRDYRHETRRDGADVWHLHPCPCCGQNEAGKDSSLFRAPDGKLGYHCFHATCPATVRVAEAGAIGRRLTGWQVLVETIGYPGREFVDLSDKAGLPAGGRPRRETRDDPPFSFGEMLWKDLDDADITLEWLVPSAIVKGQPVIVGGGSKTLKTTLVIDLLVSLTGGGRWMGVFDRPAELVPAFFVSGESGKYVLRETIRRVSKAKGIPIRESRLWVSDQLPKLAIASHVDETRRAIERTGARVFVLDPAYLALLAGDDSGGDTNLFKIGGILRDFSACAAETGATMVLIHHFRKAVRSPAGRFTPPTLEEFSFSGFGEFARQWMLLKRRSPFLEGSGRHELFASISGSAGQSSSWVLDIDEGRPADPLDQVHGRIWRVEAERYDPRVHAIGGGRGLREEVIGYIRAAGRPVANPELYGLGDEGAIRRLTATLAREGVLRPGATAGRARTYEWVDPSRLFASIADML